MYTCIFPTHNNLTLYEISSYFSHSRKNQIDTSRSNLLRIILIQSLQSRKQFSSTSLKILIIGFLQWNVVLFSEKLENIDIKHEFKMENITHSFYRTKKQNGIYKIIYFWLSIIKY